MNTNDIIEALNLHIEDKREKMNINTKGHLVLQSTIENHPTFKAFKTITYKLWFVKGKKKHLIKERQLTLKMTQSNEESVMRDINTRVCKSLFNWINSESYNQVIEGTYETSAS